MARRILNRKQLREAADQAARAKPDDQAPSAELLPAAEPAAPPTAAAPKKPRARKPAKKKEPVRMRARWGVFDGGMKQVAVFDYNQRAAADEKVAALNAGKKGTFFLQIVKDALPLVAAQAE
jgi:hypothetical protein